MASVTLANCVRCNKIFQKTSSSRCAECLAEETQQLRTMFRLLQESRSDGGILIDDLSDQVGMPVEVIEEYYLESKLGTAGIFLKFKCRECGMIIGELHRKGRFCVNCSEQVSARAGVDVRSLQDIQKEEALKRTIAEVLPSQQSTDASTDSAKKKSFREKLQHRRTGFIRNR